VNPAGAANAPAGKKTVDPDAAGVTTTAADLIGAMLGALFLALGMAAGAAAAFRARRGDRGLLWFGIFTGLYGVRLIARSHAVQTEFLLSAVGARAIIDGITYIILVPAALLAASALQSGPRDLLGLVWRANLACAVMAIGWDVAVGRPGAAVPFNRAVVVANIAIAVITVARRVRSRRFTRDAWIVLAGAALFAAIAAIENIRGGLGPVDPEPIAMLAVVLCLGQAVVKHVFQSERRMAAVGRELETARKIQQSILPRHPPAVPGLSVATHYDSMAEVAGDLFDFVHTPSGQLGVLVADVSGHGVPAAIVASMVKIALAVQEGDVADPGTVLTRMNRALCGRFELAYVTAVFALIDPAAGTLTYASAGHPSPLLRRNHGHLESLDERGIVLGFMPDATYASTVVRDVSAGDRVVFYTDGITEAARADGEFFGDREFQRLLATGPAQGPQAFMATLVDAARRWVGADFVDDVTVVIVDRVPPSM
jgi:phosphoserine phosphatase RsbU/P